MAPRKSKKVVSVTKKKKVVEETIKVTVEEGDPNVTTETESIQEETQDLTFSIPLEENVEIPVEEVRDKQPSPPQPPLEKTIKVTVVEGDPNVSAEDEETQDPAFSIPVGEYVAPAEAEEGRDEKSPQPPETPAPKGESTTVKDTHNKQGRKGTTAGKKKKNKKRADLAGDEYRRYVFKVLKQVHPELGITAKAMTVVNMFMGDMFERIAEEAAKLKDYTKRRTLSSREIEAAVRLVLPGELSRHAVAEGSKAISNYVAYGNTKRRR